MELGGYCDHNGLGQGVVDGLRAKGIRITGIYIQSGAQDSERFLNLGAELWFGLKDLITSGLLPIPTDDPDLYSQLISRKYLTRASGKIQLESKKEHKKRTGGVSPDSADAFVLCFAGITPAKLMEEQSVKTEEVEVDPRRFCNPPTSSDLLRRALSYTARKITAWDIC